MSKEVNAYSLYFAADFERRGKALLVIDLDGKGNKLEIEMNVPTTLNREIKEHIMNAVAARFGLEKPYEFTKPAPQGEAPTGRTEAGAV